MVYIIKINRTGLIKVGTTNDLRRRLDQLGAAEVLHISEGSFKEEKKLHDYFSVARTSLRGEYYKDCGLIREFIEENPTAASIIENALIKKKKKIGSHIRLESAIVAKKKSSIKNIHKADDKFIKEEPKLKYHYDSITQQETWG